jgi:hypothetical protein
VAFFMPAWLKMVRKLMPVFRLDGEHPHLHCVHSLKSREDDVNECNQLTLTSLKRPHST